MFNLAKTLTFLSPYSKPHNPTGFRQLLWSEPLCSIYNKTSPLVSYLLSQAPLEDGGDAALVSSLPSRAPVTEAPIALPSGFPANQPGLPALEAPLHTSLSTLSQDQITPPDGVSPSTPLRASLSPQAIAPLKPAVLLTHTPCKMLTSSPLATQEAQLALRAESPREQSSNASTAKSTIYESASSQLWFSAEDQPRTNLPHVKPYASRGSYRRLTKVHAAEPEDHLSPGPDVLALFKRQEKRDADVAAYKLKKEKTVSFLIPESTSGEISASSADVENADLYHLLGKKKGGPGGGAC